MVSDYLRDLVLAGVKWELIDIPMVLMPKQTEIKDKNDDTGNAFVARTLTSIVPPIAPAVPISVDTVISMAARPNDVEALNRLIAEFNHPLKAGATNVVLANIAKKPNGLVIVTDVPSGEDDVSGKLFSGAAGDLLDKMLNAVGMSRENVSIVPLVFWRTPGGRTPSRDELDLARPFVERFLEFLMPRVIITFGSLATKEISGGNLPRDHGNVLSLESGVICVPLYHPNYLILKPTVKRDVWIALQNIQNLLKNSNE